MQFTYDEKAGENSLSLENDNYKHIIKARRHKVGDVLAFRNLKNSNAYYYRIDLIDRRSATLSLQTVEEKIVELSKKLHIGWCIVDPKTVEKQLPYLNEIGVDKITFIHCEYSQKNFKMNFEKFEKILINSSQQCGRSSIIKFENCECLDKFMEQNPNTYMLNFSKNYIENSSEIETIVLGCEGGFSKDEVEKFSTDKIVGFKTPLILKSQTAITVAASKILL